MYSDSVEQAKGIVIVLFRSLAYFCHCNRHLLENYRHHCNSVSSAINVELLGEPFHIMADQTDTPVSPTGKVQFTEGVGDRPHPIKHVPTQRYDRREIQKRLDVESWMDTALRALYDCDEVRLRACVMLIVCSCCL